MSADILEIDPDVNGTDISLTMKAGGHGFLTISAIAGEDARHFAFYCLTPKNAREISKALLEWAETFERVNE